ncbi:hypothetical protein PybrP1_005398, partial [[Pythium] brassicae (nom. inval.)]
RAYSYNYEYVFISSTLASCSVHALDAVAIEFIVADKRQLVPLCRDETAPNTSDYIGDGNGASIGAEESTWVDNKTLTGLIQDAADAHGKRTIVPSKSGSTFPRYKCSCTTCTWFVNTSRTRHK